MQIITSHQNLDFDGLASMVACSKLYPDAVMVFSGRLNHDVKKFFSLYKNIISVESAQQISLDQVSEVILADINSFNRTGKFTDLDEKKITVRIYDHHPENEHTLKRAFKTIKPYGSCITVILEEIIQKKIALTPFEATLFALGIYTDTNCLTFPNTKPQDAEAVAYLLNKGANLEIINEYILTSLSKEHNQLFLSLLYSMEIVEINHYKVIICTSETDEFVDELGHLAHNILSIQNGDAIFAIVRMLNRCYIVGRSLKKDINAALILTHFGGGGLHSAASASIKDGDPNEIKKQLADILYKQVKPQITAKDIMSCPVKTIGENMTIEEVNKIILRYGHTGMPVVKDNTIIGIISRSDIDKAILHGLSHAPVKGFMRRQVKTITPDTSLNEIYSLLIKYNIGRLPVVEEDKLVGIVTRTDLLKRIHGKNYPAWYKKTFSESEEIINCKDKTEALPSKIYNILAAAGKTADESDENVFVVGGFVRDLLLNTNNWDIDFVIEGNGIEFAHKLSNKLSGKVHVHEQFGTAAVILDNNIKIDVVTARREYYEYPAALPRVEKSSIWSDLFRRDFTINCMAIQLNENSFGKLIDYFGGLEDLNNKKIRVLYNLSFVEDPTRIFRAVRFAARLGFAIEEETYHFILEAVRDKMIEKLSDERIREEIKMIFSENNLTDSIQLMVDLNIFKALHKDLKVTLPVINKINTINLSIGQFLHLYTSKNPIDKLTIIVMQLLSDFPHKKLGDVLTKFICHKPFRLQIEIGLQNKEEVYKQLSVENPDPFLLYKLMKSCAIETVIFYYNDCNKNNVKHNIMYYMLKLKNIKISISGKDLEVLNIKPGPVYRKILEQVLAARVQGKINNREDELKYASVIFENLKGEQNAGF